MAEKQENAPKKIQLLRVGAFDDGWQKFDIHVETLAFFKKNFDENVRGYPDKKLPMDYYHEGWSKAAGWIEQLYLENEGTELWAEIDWTKTAEAMILEKELRYVSVEFSFEYKDNETQQNFGPTLFGAGLTNRPFVKGMVPLSLQERNILKEKQMNLEQANAKIIELEKVISTQKTEKETTDKALSDLQAKVKEQDEKIALASKDAQFTKMLTEGKACEAQRAHFLSGDMIKFAEAAQPVNTNGKGKETNTNATGNVAEELDKKARIIMSEKKVQYGKAVSIALDENPELAKQYLDETKV